MPYWMSNASNPPPHSSHCAGGIPSTLTSHFNSSAIDPVVDMAPATGASAPGATVYTSAPGAPPATPGPSPGGGIPATDTPLLGGARRTGSSGLLMNIGYLGSTNTTSITSEAGDELAPLPRPASAGAAATPADSFDRDDVLYDYPPAVPPMLTSGSGGHAASAPGGGKRHGPHHGRSSRHRGVSLRKQHSVSCASHCCEQKL